MAKIAVKWGDFDQWGEFDHLKLRLSFYLFVQIKTMSYDRIRLFLPEIEIIRLISFNIHIQNFSTFA